MRKIIVFLEMECETWTSSHLAPLVALQKLSHMTVPLLAHGLRHHIVIVAASQLLV